MAASLRHGLAAACALLAALACGEAGGPCGAARKLAGGRCGARAGAGADQAALHRAGPPDRDQAAARGRWRERRARRPRSLRRRAANGAAGEPARGRLRPELPGDLGGRSSGRRQLRVRDRQSRGRAQTQASLRPGSPTTVWRMAGVVARALWYAALLLAAGLALFLALLRPCGACGIPPTARSAGLRSPASSPASGCSAVDRRRAARRHARRPRHGRALAHRARIAGGGERRGCRARPRGPGRRGALRPSAPHGRAPAGGRLPRRPELRRLGPCRDRRTTLAHPPGAGAPRPVRGLVGRGLRAAAARAAAPAARQALLLLRAFSGRAVLAVACLVLAGIVLAALQLRAPSGPDRDRLRPPPAAQARAGDRPLSALRRSTAWS